MADLIRVVPGPKALPGEVVLWERDNPEVGEEVFLAKAQPGEKQKSIRVVRTSFVGEKIAAGLLMEGGEELEEAQPAVSDPVLVEQQDSGTNPQGNVTPPPADNPQGSTAPPPETKLAFLTPQQRTNLAEANLRTDEEIMTATDEELDKVNGVGDQTIKAIREAAGE